MKRRGARRPRRKRWGCVTYGRDQGCSAAGRAAARTCALRPQPKRLQPWRHLPETPRSLPTWPHLSLEALPSQTSLSEAASVRSALPHDPAWKLQTLRGLAIPPAPHPTCSRSRCPTSQVGPVLISAITLVGHTWHAASHCL